MSDLATQEYIRKAREEGTPYVIHRGGAEIEGYRLSHVEWHPNSWFGGYGQPETGVRRVVDGKDVRESFFLAQHGWWGFDAATDPIAKALAKDWDEYRINELMKWMLERYRVLRVEHPNIDLPEESADGDG